ncbi:MAG: N-acetylneuraminate synthase family protein [Bacteroidetes bacterium]|nr:N-acetylneuraminate synthase family protein [Bacteroidota bacterium]
MEITLSHLDTHLEHLASSYTTDTIFILGKGPSIDQIDPSIFKNCFTIGINDSERIHPVDVSIFHADWAEKAVSENGQKSRFYLMAGQPSLLTRDYSVLPYIPLTQASSDLIMQRFLADSLEIEDIMFLSALKVARKIADIRKRPQTVYLAGFDFDLNAGFSTKLGKVYATESFEEGSIRVLIQENYFLSALYFLKESNLRVFHVGGRPYSALSPAELNSRHSKTYAKSQYVGNVLIVAELTTNHFGDRMRLERMIRASKSAGADFIKLQKRDVDSFYTPDQLKSPYFSPFGNTFGDYRYQLELSKDDFAFVDQLCKEIGIGWFVSVLDEPSFYFMLDLKPAMIKLPSTISEKKDYLKFVAGHYHGDLVLSTGMTTMDYEQFVIENFKTNNKLYLLQCNSAYPTPLHDCHIGVIRHYHELSRQYPRIIPGYSSHDLGWKASALAVAAGARMLEKHVKWGNTEWAHFDAVAVDLTTQAFTEYVDHVREAELIVGSEIKTIQSSEHHKY